MKKSYIFGLLTGLIIAGVIGVSATILYQADEVGFTPDDPNWNVNNLEDALNDLYTNSTNSNLGNPDKTFNSYETITIDDDYSTCFAAVARKYEIPFELNNETVTPMFQYCYSAGGVCLLTHVFHDLKENDTISFVGYASVTCYK